MKAGKKRTYYFDVKQTKGNDYYLVLTESARRLNDTGFDRHKIFIYKEDFNRFINQLQATIDHVKTNLLPDFDYTQFENIEDYWDESNKSNNEKNDSENLNW